MVKFRALGLISLGIVAGLTAACGGDDGSTTNTPGTTCTSVPEACDGKDNDCDGQVDEDLTQSCTDNGQAGEQTCQNGQWGTCNTTCTPAAETCDGKDNDCDSAIDEDDSGNALTKTCTDGSGLEGTQACASGAWGPCESNCTPSPELCDGKDNDCDGTVDEDDTGGPLKQDCSNDCGLGTEVCAGGQWTSCTAPVPSTEVCDGVDNDCDKQIDEDFDCRMGSTDSCGSNVGECEFGTKTCGPTCVWGVCQGSVTAGTEACDGVKDEDCDGTVDNGCGCTDGATKPCCGGVDITCAGGTWPSCPAAPTETCNGQDDDCDGETDEGLPVDPYQLDEDISGTDDCAHADVITSPIVEGAGSQSFDYHLYKADGTEDRDYIYFRADEDSDLACVLHPSYYECYSATIKVAGPTGTDYDFCVYDIGFEQSTATCAAPEQKICAADEAPFNEVTINWQGDCGFDDNRYMIAEVFAKTGTTTSCEPYTITVESADNSPQDVECTF